MTNAQRAEYVRALRALEAPIQAGNADAVKAMTVASVAASFEGIAQSIQSLSPQIQGAAFTIGSMYQLNASDLKTPQEETQFFCSVPGSSLVVTATIPQLPPGIYLLALLHATGVQHPQQVALILQKDGDDWKLAGFFVRPMSLGGREGVWYWAQARQYAQKRQDWNSYFYYETAAFLLTPVPDESESRKAAEGGTDGAASRAARRRADEAGRKWANIRDYFGANRRVCR
jgi:hypothetical protein